LNISSSDHGGQRNSRLVRKWSGIQICYKSSNEILRILQDIKAIESIGRVEWSEIVQLITKGNPDVFERFEEISLHHSDDIKK
jgi:hypothetical protein